jgi:hypothetical protein
MLKNEMKPPNGTWNLLVLTRHLYGTVLSTSDKLLAYHLTQIHVPHLIRKHFRMGRIRQIQVLGLRDGVLVVTDSSLDNKSGKSKVLAQ